MTKQKPAGEIERHPRLEIDSSPTMTRLAGPHICTDQLRLSADGPRLPIIPIPTALLSE